MKRAVLLRRSMATKEQQEEEEFRKTCQAELEHENPVTDDRFAEFVSDACSRLFSPGPNCTKENSSFVDLPRNVQLVFMSILCPEFPQACLDAFQSHQIPFSIANSTVDQLCSLTYPVLHSEGLLQAAALPTTSHPTSSSRIAPPPSMAPMNSTNSSLSNWTVPSVSSTASSKRSSNVVLIAVGAIILLSIIVLLLFAIIWWYYCRPRRQQQKNTIPNLKIHATFSDSVVHHVSDEASVSSENSQPIVVDDTISKSSRDSSTRRRTRKRRHVFEYPSPLSETSPIQLSKNNPVLVRKRFKTCDHDEYEIHDTLFADQLVPL